MSASRFGDRWERIEPDPIGEGGQSQVFLVRDITGEFSDNCVLKRLKNIKRLDRFGSMSLLQKARERRENRII